MSLSAWCWICIAAAGLQIFEEFCFDWVGWINSISKLKMDWPSFYVGNGMMLLLGMVAAVLAPTHPEFALTLPAGLLINALFFHIGSFLWKRRRFSPGLITAVLLFFPLGIECFRVALRHNLITPYGMIEPGVLAMGVMMTPIVFIRLKDKPYFRQPR